MADPKRPFTAREQVIDYRQRLRRQGYHPIQIWSRCPTHHRVRGIAPHTSASSVRTSVASVITPRPKPPRALCLSPHRCYLPRLDCDSSGYQTAGSS